MAKDARQTDKEHSRALEKLRNVLNKLPSAASLVQSSANDLVEETSKQLRQHVSKHLQQQGGHIEAVLKLAAAFTEHLLSQHNTASREDLQIEAQSTKWLLALRYSITGVSNTITSFQLSNAQKGEHRSAFMLSSSISPRNLHNHNGPAYKIIQSHLVPQWAAAARLGLKMHEEHARRDVVTVAISALLEVATLDKAHRQDILRSISIKELGQIYSCATDYHLAADCMEIGLLTKPKNTGNARRAHWQAFFTCWEAEIDQRGQASSMPAEDGVIFEEGYRSALQQLSELRDESRFDAIASDAIDAHSLGHQRRPRRIICSNISAEGAADWLLARPCSMEAYNSLAKSQATDVKVPADFVLWINSDSVAMDLVDPAFVEGVEAEMVLIPTRIEFENVTTITFSEHLITFDLKKSVSVASEGGKKYDLGSNLHLTAKDRSEAQRLQTAIKYRTKDSDVQIHTFTTEPEPAGRFQDGVTNHFRADDNIPEVIASKLTDLPPPMLKRSGPTARSAVICQLPDHPKLPECSPEASQLEVRRERAEEMRLAAASEADPYLLARAENNEPPNEHLGAESNPKSGPAEVETTRRRANPPQRTETAVTNPHPKGKTKTLTLSDSPVDRQLVSSDGAGQFLRVSDGRSRRSVRRPNYVEVSSDLSELSDEDEQAEAPKAPAPGSPPKESNSRGPMRALSLTVPKAPHRIDKTKYSAKLKANVKVHDSGSGSETSVEGKSLQIEKPKRSTARHDSERSDHTQSTEEKRSESPVSSNNIDWDAIPGEESASATICTGKKRDSDKSRGKGGSKGKRVAGVNKKLQHAGDSSEEEGDQDSGLTKTRKRKATAEKESLKRQKLAQPPIPQNARGKLTAHDPHSKESAKSRDGAEKSNAMGMATAGAQVRKPGQKSAFLLDAMSSTPDTRQKSRKKVPKRPVHPWNRPSQNSGAEAVIQDKVGKLNDSNQQASRSRAEKGAEQQSLPLTDTIKLPMAESPFGDSQRKTAEVGRTENLEFLNSDDNGDLSAGSFHFNESFEVNNEHLGFVDPGTVRTSALVKKTFNPESSSESLAAQEGSTIDIRPGRLNEAAEKAHHISVRQAVAAERDPSPSEERGNVIQARQPPRPLTRKQHNPQLQESTVMNKTNEGARMDSVLDLQPGQASNFTGIAQENERIDINTKRPTAVSPSPKAADVEGRIDDKITAGDEQSPLKLTHDISAVRMARDDDEIGDSTTLLEMKAASLPSLGLYNRKHRDVLPRFAPPNNITTKQILQNQKEDEHRTDPTKQAGQHRLERSRKNEAQASKWPLKQPVREADAEPISQIEDPELEAALRIVRKSRKTASTLREVRRHANIAENEKATATQTTIEELALEFIKTLCKAQENETKGLQMQARSDLRRLMQAVFDQFSEMEDQE
ncbi:hypothetical protein OC861_003379 [Tilletia horrida]|nr:hypothetical protein OC861_003379 [Tilletia horrida]